MKNAILFTWLNDFIFCPVSIYFHNIFGESSGIAFQETSQINGTAAHNAIESGSYSTRKDVISAMMVYSSNYGLIGKIDVYDILKKKLIERKKHIKKIYDGYIFQLFGQCFALREMGYEVNSLALYSLDDNKTYPIPLPEKNNHLLEKFEKTIRDIKEFDIFKFNQTNENKCRNCIREPLCDASLL